jgi:GR25 family glycosyltransferase involved in LPS biosynthesis
MIFLVIIIFIFIMMIFYQSKYINHLTFCIHLPTETRRKDKIKRYFKNIRFFQAIDTRGQKWIDYSDILTTRAIHQLHETSINKFRWKHSDLTPGAIGCFLSHLSLYKHLQTMSNKRIFLIIEDDSIPHYDFTDYLKKTLDNMPKDTDLYLLNYHVIGKLTFIPDADCYKLPFHSRFYLLNCYLITQDGIRKVLDNFHKIDVQIDSWLSDLNRQEKINIYCSKKIICSQDPSASTTIQIYNVPFNQL